MRGRQNKDEVSVIGSLLTGPTGSAVPWKRGPGFQHQASWVLAPACNVGERGHLGRLGHVWVITQQMWLVSGQLQILPKGRNCGPLAAPVDGALGGA